MSARVGGKQRGSPVIARVADKQQESRVNGADLGETARVKQKKIIISKKLKSKAFIDQ